MTKRMSTQLHLEGLVASSVERLQLLPSAAQHAQTADWEEGLKEPCVKWERGKIGNKNPEKRYGAIYINRSQVLAHRHAFVLAFGKIPKGKQVCHRCDCPNCVNPFHLFSGTQQQNIDDMRNKGREYHGLGLVGSKHSKSIYSESQVVQMRKLFDSGQRVCAINRLFGGAYQSVWLIVKRKNRRHG